jgi:hypothetical protein
LVQNAGIAERMQASGNWALMDGLDATGGKPIHDPPMAATLG